MSSEVVSQTPSAAYLAANKGPQTLVLVIVFPAVALLIVGLRLYTRFCVVRSPSHEDYAIAVAMTFSIGCCVCQSFQVLNGMGRHKEAVTFDQAVASLKALYGSIICYGFGITLTKVSILLQYLRIATDRSTRLVCWIFLWFTVVVCVMVFVTGVFQCIPVARFWDSRIPGKCVNEGALYYTNSAINIVQDISLVILPFFILRDLIMPKREKITLMVILGLGGVAAVASICRLHAIYVLETTKDITWDSRFAAIWSAIELNIGIMCASLPTLRALFIKIWPKAFISSFNSRRAAAASAEATKGQYYNMEGSIMVKKTITVRNSRAVDDQITVKSEQSILPKGASDSEHELSTL